MDSSVLWHRTLGEITPELQARLVELVNDASAKAKPDSLSSVQRAVLLDIASLQVKAKRTFGAAAASKAWWVTRHGLQQSTQHRVARLKASLMRDAPVVDLCCGLGSDLLALAHRGPTIGIDLDPDVLAFAQANLHACDATASLCLLDVEQTIPDRLVAGADFLHVDPDRRVGGRRHTEADDLIPSWSRVLELARVCRGGLVKLAPATVLSEGDSGCLHRTWISTSGSVREQTAIFGEILDHPWLRQHAMRVGNRSAIGIRGDTVSVFSGQPHDSLSCGEAGLGVGQWLVDPDAAIRAAGLTEAFAAAANCRRVDRSSGFLTGDSLAGLAPWLSMAKVAQVVDVLGCDDRKLRRFFRARNGYPEIIKVRGVDIDPGQLQRRMKQCGEIPMGLWIGRQGKRTYAAITEMPTGSQAG